MNIEQYIAQLLYRHQCVTVPGFGAFLTEIQSAHFEENSNSFFPPRKIVSFNSHIKNNDGLLATHISQIKKLSYEAVVDSINQDVSAWKNNLQSFQYLNLKNIGNFYQNSEGNLVFEASNDVNFHSASFGLSPFVAPAVKRDAFIKQIEKLEEENVVPLNPSSKSNSYLKYAAVFLLSMGLTGSIGYKLYNDNLIAQTQIAQIEVQKEVQNKIQEATFFIKNPLPNVTLSVKPSTMSYHIVAGSFRSERNAQKALLKLTQLGFKAKRIQKNNFGLYPVLYASYPSFNEAQNDMKEIREKYDAKAWLLIKDL
jgi:CCDC81-like prokaryotic HU domain 1/CCDC81-like prokaryotic HU domain 2/SPOR domain